MLAGGSVGQSASYLAVEKVARLVVATVVELEF